MKTNTYLTFCLGLLALALFFTPACGGDDDHDTPEIDCDAVTAPAFAEVNMFNQCVSCHSTTIEGAARAGAPADINYDTYDEAVMNAAHGVEEVYAGTMPPTGVVAEADKQAFYAWALCGQPQ